MFSWLLMQTQSDRVAHGGRRHRGLNTPPRGPACDGLAVGVSAEQVVVLLVVRLVVASVLAHVACTELDVKSVFCVFEHGLEKT